MVRTDFYKKFTKNPVDGLAFFAICGIINWERICVDPMSQLVKNKTKIYIKTRVATEDYNKIFHKTLETGYADSTSTDVYSSNYIFFQNKCNEYATSSPLNWKNLCLTILHRCIVLPPKWQTTNYNGWAQADAECYLELFGNKVVFERKLNI